METTKVYDFVIVGGGIAGLYAAYRIKQKHSVATILILEKEDHVGGRAGTHIFHQIPIAIGAGVGRKDKDHFLVNLLKELSIPNHEFQTETHYTSGLEEGAKLLRKQFQYLRTAFRDPRIHREFSDKPFSEFAKEILGQKEYDIFKQCAGYTDFEQSDIHDILYDYSFDDNMQSWTGISLHWLDVIEALAQKIDRSNIRMNEPVLQILQEDQTHQTYQTIITSKRRYYSKKVIIASTIDTVKRLIPSKREIYNEICGQTFLRMYGKFTKSSARIMAQYVSSQTVVQGPIHKIIPINAEKGIHMIVYSDNKDAKKLARYRENTAENREILCKYLEKALTIPPDTLTMTDMCDYYWKIGTHYYAPLDKSYSSRSDFIKKAQRPFPKMFVVGEMISRNQGWVEGALDSVERVFSSF